MGNLYWVILYSPSFWQRFGSTSAVSRLGWTKLGMENPIIDEINTIVDNIQKDENLDGLLKDMEKFKEFWDFVESRLHRQGSI